MIINLDEGAWRALKREMPQYSAQQMRDRIEYYGVLITDEERDDILEKAMDNPFQEPYYDFEGNCNDVDDEFGCFSDYASDVIMSANELQLEKDNLITTLLDSKKFYE